MPRFEPCLLSLLPEVLDTTGRNKYERFINTINSFRIERQKKKNSSNTASMRQCPETKHFVIFSLVKKLKNQICKSPFFFLLD
jgi:hypothetical protein